MRRASALSDEIFARAREGALQRPEREGARVVGRAELPGGRSRRALVRSGGGRGRDRRDAACRAGRRSDRAGRPRHDRRGLHRRRLLLGLHAHVRGGRGLGAAAGAARALPRGAARRTRRGGTGRARAGCGRSFALASSMPPGTARRTGTGWATASGCRSTRRPRCVPSRRTSSRRATSSPSSRVSTCRTRAAASGSRISSS